MENITATAHNRGVAKVIENTRTHSRRPKVATVYGHALSNVIPSSSITFSFHNHDGLGSTVALTNSSGNVIESYLYDVYGKPTVLNASNTAITASAFGNRFLFTGREWISRIGIYDYRNRVYSPDLGRFIQTDPIRFDAGDGNIYRYVGNKPVNWTDPSGKIVHQLIAGTVTAVLVGVASIITLHNLNEAAKKAEKEREDLKCKQSGDDPNDPFGVQDELDRINAVNDSIRDGAIRDAADSGGSLGPSSPIPAP